MTILVPQQRDRDCGIACLATYFQIKYGDANDAVLVALGTRLGAGVYGTTLMRAAEKLGKKLRRRRKFDLATAAGILGVEGKTGHFVVLLGHGMLYDPEDNALWGANAYLTHYGFVARGLLS